WLKVKVPRSQSFVIAGWMPSDTHPDRIGSLVLAVYDAAVKPAASVSRGPQLVYAGRVGTGFKRRTLELLQEILLPMQIEHSPLDQGSPPVGARFVRPALVCEVAFREWTLGGEIRHPSFQRLRTDMHPSEVVREGQ